MTRLCATRVITLSTATFGERLATDEANSRLSKPTMPIWVIFVITAWTGLKETEAEARDSMMSVLSCGNLRGRVRRQLRGSDSKNELPSFLRSNPRMRKEQNLGL